MEFKFPSNLYFIYLIEYRENKIFIDYNIPLTSLIDCQGNRIEIFLINLISLIRRLWS